jgi:asparagine synthase (glutamine-hydrolysing)
MDSLAHFGIQLRDPMGDRRLMEQLLTFPLHAFRADGRPRGLAREIGKNVLPEQVRLRKTRGEQCADEAAWFVAHESRYRDTFDAVRHSGTAAEILDLDRLAQQLEKLFAGRASYLAPLSVHRALDVGLFALAAESGVFAADDSSRRSE